MTFSSSNPKDISESIPTQLSRAAEASSQVFTNKNIKYDVAIAGVAFQLASNDQTPYLRETAQVQKQQFDNSKEAGEQTLDGYWIRSQTSWHNGEGVRFYEPGTDADTAFRYEESLGVDVWDKDNATLLKRCRVAAEGFTWTVGTELRRNLVPNPSFEVDLTGWTGPGTAAATMSRDATVGWSGSASLKVVRTSTGTFNITSDFIPVTEGETYTVSFYYKSTSAQTGGAIIHWRNGATIVAQQSVGVPVSPDWTRITYTGTAPVGATSILINLFTANGVAGDVYWWDAFLVEKAASAGSYFDGSFTDDYATAYQWTGTAHNSASITGTAVETPTSPATVGATQRAFVTGAVVGGVNCLFTNENGTVRRRIGPTGGVAATYTGAFATPETAVAVAGTKIIVGHGLGIEAGDASGSTFSTLYTQSLATALSPHFVKSRIIARKGHRLFELALDGTSGGGNVDTVTPLHVHPDSNWTWTDVTEGPSAIYASGYANGKSSIYRFSLQDASSGSTPELSQAYQVAEMPSGEEIYAIHVALGSFMGIGTTKGLRVAAILDDGSLALGPLLFKSAKPVRNITSSDRFLYAAVQEAHPDGKSGAVRVDLSASIGSANALRFAYAWDARRGDTGKVTNVALLGISSQVALGIEGDGIYLQAADSYESSGYIRSGRIRYGTVEKKMFRTLEVGTQPYDGSVKVYSVDEDGDETYLRTITSDSGSETVSLTTVPGIYEFLRFKTELVASDDQSQSPILNSLQVRALPAVRRQRLIQFPLLCVDFEQSAAGVKYGREGFAYQRLSGLEAAEEYGLVVLVQDFSTDESYEAVIEQVSFRRPGPKSTDDRKNFGGILTVTVRKL